MRAAAAVLLSLLLAIPVLGAVRDEPRSPLAFARVPDPWPSVGGMAVRPLPARVDLVRPLPSDASSVGGARPSGSRPLAPAPSPHLIVVETGGTDTGRTRPHRVAGAASWFCGHGSRCTRGYGSGLYAAAGPALRTGNWRGRVVVVTAGGRSVRVTLIDCNCGPDANLIDLYSDAFQRLAPLSRGVVSVTVSW